MPELLYRGTRFSFTKEDSEDQSSFEYMLADCFEEGYVFQLICISGYHAGLICGYVKDANSSLDTGRKAITQENLIDEINRNFLEVDQASIKIYQSPS